MAFFFGKALNVKHKKTKKMGFNSCSFLLKISVAIGLLLICADPPMAGAMSLSGDWRYQRAQDQGDSFTRNYTADFNKSLHVSDVLSFKGGCRYNERRDNTSATYTLSLTPSLDYATRGELFNFNLCHVTSF